MNFIRVTCAAGVLLVGTMVPAYAQRDQQGDKQGNPEKQDRGGPAGRRLRSSIRRITQQNIFCLTGPRRS